MGSGFVERRSQYGTTASHEPVTRNDPIHAHRFFWHLFGGFHDVIEGLHHRPDRKLREALLDAILNLLLGIEFQAVGARDLAGQILQFVAGGAHRRLQRFHAGALDCACFCFLVQLGTKAGVVGAIPELILILWILQTRITVFTMRFPQPANIRIPRRGWIIVITMTAESIEKKSHVHNSAAGNTVVFRIHVLAFCT